MRTRHGHHVYGTRVTEVPGSDIIERCGGPEFCEACAADALTIYQYCMKPNSHIFTNEVDLMIDKLTKRVKNNKASHPTNGRYEHVRFDEETLRKVYASLTEYVSEKVATQIVDDMQSRGILFRERAE